MLDAAEHVIKKKVYGCWNSSDKGDEADAAIRDLFSPDISG